MKIRLLLITLLCIGCSGSDGSSTTHTDATQGGDSQVSTDSTQPDAQGTDGADGADGTDGTDGTDGVDGSSGEPGQCKKAKDCDDGKFCNGQEKCEPGNPKSLDNGCVPGPLPKGNDPDPTDCAILGPCDEETQSFPLINLEADSSCDDGIACTLGDICDADGECKGNPTDSTCNDGLFCNGVETCNTVLGCISGKAPEFTDTNLEDCLKPGPCDESTQTAVLIPVETGQACDDNVACTNEDGCTGAGTCEGKPMDSQCDDQVECTVDSCDLKGGCVNTPTDSLCETNELCVTQTCSATEGCVQETTSNCCGNKIKEANEACDDGNSDDGDGCSSTCQLDLTNGTECTKDTECNSGFCRTDWTDSTSYCAQDATSCVYVGDDSTVVQHPNGYRECGAGDSFKVCKDGVWGSTTTCGATTCDGGCGYITDEDNACISGKPGGCEANLGQDITCIDCGAFTASAGGCNETLDGCSTQCGASCEKEGISISDKPYCGSDDGDSMNAVFTCQLSGGGCEYTDDNNTSNDTVAQECGNLDCNASTGKCLETCSGDSDCNTNFHCANGACVATLPNGSACTDKTNCTSGHCQNGFCCAEGDCCSAATDCPGTYSTAATCDDAASCQGTRQDATCDANQCASAEVADDSACNSAVEANACGLYQSALCDGSANQTTPSCPTTCTGDTDCDANAYCDGTCKSTLDSGQSCTDNSQCTSGHCQNGFCCAAGDCCSAATDCPGTYSAAATCDDAATCQGTRKDATCTANQCGTNANVADDSACTSAVTVDTCGLYKSAFCNGSADQTAPACPTACTGDTDCDANAYCDGTCKSTLDSGQSCTNASQCTSGHCQNGFCCAAGDCCSTATDCPGSYSAAATCNDAATCQGARKDATCAANQCGSAEVADDSACNSAVEANTCGLYQSALCNGSADQTAPACPTACTGDADCDANAYCDGTCKVELSDGQSCTKAADCLSGHCQNGFCCAGGDCCSLATDCPGSYSAAATCDDVATCQGTRQDATCTANQCGTNANVPDDSACTSGIIVNTCGLFESVFCDGSDDQTTPSCPTACVTNANCDSNAHCDGGECLADLANGAICNDASNCISGHCVDGFCCDTPCGGDDTSDCQSCAASQTGGANGTCAVIPAVANYICAGAGASATCDPADVCDGASTSCPINIAPDATSCGSGPSCSGSNSTYSQIGASSCVAGECSGGGTQKDCSGFVCNGNVCFEKCEGENPHSACDDSSHCGDCSASGATSCSGDICVADTISFAATVQPIFNARCNGCHSGASAWNHSTMVDSDVDTSYCNGFQKQVKPGDPIESCIWNQIDVGGTMRSWSGISNGEVNTIRQWILEGAKDN